jgi:hypothetical protein
MSSKRIPSSSARAALAAVALLTASVLLVLDGRTAARADTPPKFVDGFYASYFRRTDGGSTTLVPTPRSVQIQVLKLGLKVTAYTKGQFQGSQVLVPTCVLSYNAQLGHWFQNFETVPSNKNVPVEKIEFVFRRNDFGDYDVYYTQPDNSVRSEILVRQ